MTEDRFEVIHREGGALADAGIRMVLRDRGRECAISGSGAATGVG